MRSAILLMLLVSGLLVASSASHAQPRSASTAASYWTSEAYLPLAVVTRGRLRAAVKCNGKLDSQPYRAIDAWGQPVGEVRRTTTSTGLSSIGLLSGTRGVGVYVRSPNGYPPPSAEWQPSRSVRASFDTYLRTKSLGAHPRSRFFRNVAPAQPAEFAVVATDESLAVAIRTPKGWTMVHENGIESDWRVFELRAIVDMNGDGMAEVIYHWNEYADGRGHEVVLSPSRGGTSWREVADNVDDCP